jgi:hypothetical protein
MGTGGWVRLNGAGWRGWRFAPTSRRITAASSRVCGLGLSQPELRVEAKRRACFGNDAVIIRDVVDTGPRVTARSAAWARHRRK